LRFRVYSSPRERRSGHTELQVHDDFMTQHTLTRFDSQRHTGTGRFAASWRASADATGAGVCGWPAGRSGSKRSMRSIRLDVRDRAELGREAQQDTASMSGSRPLDRRRSGAESRGRAGTP
jgi:hypothetical protein